jgi:hypothetical protein
MEIRVEGKTQTNQKKPHVHSRRFNLPLIQENTSCAPKSPKKEKKKGKNWNE